MVVQGIIDRIYPPKKDDKGNNCWVILVQELSTPKNGKTFNQIKFTCSYPEVVGKLITNVGYELEFVIQTKEYVPKYTFKSEKEILNEVILLNAKQLK